MRAGEKRQKGNYKAAILLSLIVVATMLLFTFCSTGSCTTGKAVQVSVPSGTVNIGDTVVATVAVSSATDLSGYDVDMSYNPVVLRLETITHGTWLAQGSTLFAPAITKTTTPGVITDVVGVRQSASGRSGSGTLFTVTFTAIASGTSGITITNADYANSQGSSQTHTSSGTSLTVQAQTPVDPEPSNTEIEEEPTNEEDTTPPDESTTPPEQNEPGDTGSTGSSGSSSSGSTGTSTGSSSGLSSGGGGGGGGGGSRASTTTTSGQSSVFRSWMESITGTQKSEQETAKPKSTVRFTGQGNALVQDAQLTVTSDSTATVTVTKPQESILSLGTPRGFSVLDAVVVEGQGFTSQDIVSATIKLRIPLETLGDFSSRDLQVYGLSQGAWKNVKIIKRDLGPEAVTLTVQPAELGLLTIGVQEVQPLQPIEEQKPRAVVAAEEASAKRWNALSWIIAGIAVVVVVLGVGGGIYWHQRSKKEPVAKQEMSMAERYVERLRKQQFSDAEIRAGLEKAGWPENLIEDVLVHPAIETARSESADTSQ